MIAMVSRSSAAHRARSRVNAAAKASARSNVARRPYTALKMALRRMGMHREIAEAALAHVTGDKAERAYRRGDALEKRRMLMAEWGRLFLLFPQRNQNSFPHRKDRSHCPLK